MTDININRIRTGDKFVTKEGRKLTVKECWNDGRGLFQLTTEEDNDSRKVYTYQINGKAFTDDTSDMVEFTEVESEEDKVTYYVPKFDIDVLPVLTVNGENKLVYGIIDLNGLEIKEPQVLKAGFKYTIIASLEKKTGRDVEVIKQEQIICDSREDCEEKLLEIQGHLIGKGVDKEAIQNNFTQSIDTLQKNVD